MGKKDALEQLADLILLDDAIREGYVTNTGNRHGFGKYMRDRGMINNAYRAEIDKHEKTGFTETQIEDIEEFGVRDERGKYE